MKHLHVLVRRPRARRVRKRTYGQHRRRALASQGTRIQRGPIAEQVRIPADKRAVVPATHAVGTVQPRPRQRRLSLLLQLVLHIHAGGLFGQQLQLDQLLLTLLFLKADRRQQRFAAHQPQVCQLPADHVRVRCGARDPASRRILSWIALLLLVLLVLLQVRHRIGVIGLVVGWRHGRRGGLSAEIAEPIAGAIARKVAARLCSATVARPVVRPHDVSVGTELRAALRQVRSGLQGSHLLPDTRPSPLMHLLTTPRAVKAPQRSRSAVKVGGSKATLKAAGRSTTGVAAAGHSGPMVSLQTSTIAAVPDRRERRAVELLTQQQRAADFSSGPRRGVSGPDPGSLAVLIPVARRHGKTGADKPPIDLPKVLRGASGDGRLPERVIPFLNLHSSQQSSAPAPKVSEAEKTYLLGQEGVRGGGDPAWRLIRSAIAHPVRPSPMRRRSRRVPVVQKRCCARSGHMRRQLIAVQVPAFCDTCPFHRCCAGFPPVAVCAVARPDVAASVMKAVVVMDGTRKSIVGFGLQTVLNHVIDAP